MRYLMSIHFSTVDAISMSTNSQIRYSGYRLQSGSIAYVAETLCWSVGPEVELGCCSCYLVAFFP